MSDPGDPASLLTFSHFRGLIAEIRGRGVTIREAFRGKLPELFGPLFDPHLLDPDAGVDRYLAILDAVTPADRADLAAIDAEGARRVAAAAGVEPAQVATVLDLYRELLRTVERELRGEDPGDRVPPDSRVGRLDASRLHPSEPGEFRELWQHLTRTGRVPPHGAGPWYSAWNREFHAWDFTLDD
ncbi:hypothetical protein [Tautonia plasticadhaerens]|uniref:Uncharacterized protein n=1 Tax=Tautonia plasticadhaerens TaxID=2527974 RepID=A0A518HCS5_9BACT|nr:hypothetical protein [Tautonia plasticadhaerens]QDV38662.1 hypothetical protein ElP_66170 [Tautonia plasticadhaerens]